MTDQLALPLACLADPPRYPSARASVQWTILSALRRGEHLTVAVALEKYNVYALSQECGRLRNLGWPVQSKRIKLSSGKTVKEYWI